MVESQDDVLVFLKRRDEATTIEIAQHLGVTVQAARERLGRLAARGVLGFEDRRAGVGRPQRQWRLAEASAAQFPDRHGQLAVELVEAIHEELGEAALDRVIDRRSMRQLAAYRRALAPERTLEAKLTALARLRSEEGYMARAERCGDAFVLIEDHCPICAVARTCQGFCRSELEIFRLVLGSACRVERTDHLIAGARRCAYRVEPSE